MSFIPSPDWRAAQRGNVWHEYPHVVVLPPASGQTINIGDLVSVTNGEVSRISGNDGAALPNTVAIFGVALGRSAAYALDTELYRGVPVATLGERPYVVLRKLTNDGTPTTTTTADIGRNVTLRMGKANTEAVGVLGVSLSGSGDTVHGVVVDVVGEHFLLVRINSEYLRTG